MDWKREKELLILAIEQNSSVLKELKDPEEIQYFKSVYAQVKKAKDEGKRIEWQIPYDFD